MFQGQTHLIKTLRRYNSMNDLLNYDDMDGVRPRAMSTTSSHGSTFDPDEDAAILQKQYKSYRQQNYIREDSQAE